MKIKFAGIHRKTEFSPNHEVNDLLIIERTAEELLKLGAEVKMYDESELSYNKITEQLIFSMVQGPAGIKELLTIEASGSLIINSPTSVLSCYRLNMSELLPSAGLPFPKSLMMSTSIQLNGELNTITSSKLWVKRSDVHAVQKEDVIGLEAEPEELCRILNDFRLRNIPHVILQEHIEGDTIKFYAVRGTKFFHWYYLENKYNYKFSSKNVVELATASAQVLGLDIYGGDAIISKNGIITIIDINDWPSFAPVRDEAAYYIAKLLYKKGKQYVNFS